MEGDSMEGGVDSMNQRDGIASRQIDKTSQIIYGNKKQISKHSKTKLFDYYRLFLCNLCNHRVIDRYYLLYYTILYYTKLYYTKLYYTII